MNDLIKDLRNEWKRSEYLYYKSYDINLKHELGLNMADIRSKITQLELEEEHIEKVIKGVIA
ncbi:hypothetical protein HKO22_00640 [Peptoniphilus sp. AGMB00490]|uniref:Uncharacterized protein n=1 Tax=Peptoniphilus faecalis TaxID=2731255 RepID=A0A848RBP7_9FIRM|nr:hypothetical protein [Peptoniphilus faecalis]NMW84250.1 hypothetical protein [Peptoniphilus faecalis]